MLVVIAQANRLIDRYLSIVKFLKGKKGVVGRDIVRSGTSGRHVSPRH